VTDAYDERDDDAIARALGGDDASADDAATAEFRRVLTHMPFAEVEPPPDLEERVLAAARARRRGVTRSLGRRPARPFRRAGVALLAAAAAIAAVVALAVEARDPAGPRGRIENVAAPRADVARLTSERGARLGVFSGDAGRVVLTRDGAGYIYDLAADEVEVGVEAGSATTRLGTARPRAGVVAFVVDDPDRVTAVRLRLPDGELVRAELRAR
jgi:hypothetical protein